MKAKDFILAEITNDKYEFIVNFWESFQDCADYYKISLHNVYARIYNEKRDHVHKKSTILIKINF